jgi:aspartyl-tRNA(Asn)/glutamyl-tRNA(Gln) amidotransferase subunit C
LTRDEVKQIARLARLEFDDAGLDRFIPRFEQILCYFEQLKGIETDSVEPTYHAVWGELNTPLREDQTAPSLTVDEAVDGAPDSRDGCYRVPKVIE